MGNVKSDLKYKGSALFKTVGIIMLLFCLVSFVIHVVLFIITAAIAKTVPYILPLVVAMCLGTLGAVFGMVAGVDGILYSKRPLKMNKCMLLDIGFIVLTIASVIFSFISFKTPFLFGFLGMLASALIFFAYLYCAYKCKKLEFENNTSAVVS